MNEEEMKSEPLLSAILEVTRNMRRPVSRRISSHASLVANNAQPTTRSQCKELVVQGLRSLPYTIANFVRTLRKIGPIIPISNSS